MLRPPDSLVMLCVSARDASSAGARPNSTAVPHAHDQEEQKRLPVERHLVGAGDLRRADGDRTSTPQNASATPAAPPASDNSRLSARNCRTRRSGPAPSAARVTISCVRAVVRARSRLATFAHAAASTSADRAKQQPQRPVHGAEDFVGQRA